MNRHIAVIGAVVRKDFFLLWPLVALIAALQMLQITYFDLSNMTGDALTAMGQIHLTVLYIAIAVLVVSAVQTDAFVSVRHDWLTKPIPRFDLLAAKTVFVAVAYAIPSTLIETIVYFAKFDASIVEAYSRAAKSFAFVVVLIGIGAVASFTATLLQAAMTLVGVVLIASLAFAIALPSSGLTEAYFDSGAQWVLQQCWICLTAVLGLTVLWLQFGHRKTKYSRALFAAGVVLIPMIPIVLSWDRVFTLQKSLASDPKVADAIGLKLESPCFQSVPVSPSMGTQEFGAGLQSTATQTQLDPSMWTLEQRKIAGPDAIGFATALSVSGIPDQWRLHFSRVQADYVNADGTEIVAKTPLRMPPQWRAVGNEQFAIHFWLLSHSAYKSIAEHSSPQFQINYSLSLLEPSASFELPIDGSRQYSADIGYCSAQADRALSSVTVNCFKRGPQADLLAAEIVGVPASDSPISFPDFTPDWLEAFKGVSHVRTLRHPSNVVVSRLKVTAYRARAHFDRRIVAPGILGGPTSKCPAPSVTP